MKRFITRYIGFHVLLLVLVSGIWLGAAYVWLESVMREALLPRVVPSVYQLAPLVSSKIPPQAAIKNILAKLSRDNVIDHAVVTDAAGTVIVARGTPKRPLLIWPLNTSLDIRRGSTVLGRLKVWPSPESVFREITHGRNCGMLLLFFAAWWIFVIGALSWYFVTTVAGPLRRIQEFAGRIGDGGPPLDRTGLDGEWRPLAERLERLDVKIADVNATVAMLFSVSQTLSSRLDINEVFAILIDIIQKKFGDVSSAILLLGEDGFLKIRSQRGFSPDFIRAIHLRPGEGYAGHAFAKCQTMVVNDADEMEEVITKHTIEAEGIRSFAHLPLISESRCIGILNVATREKNFFNEERVESLATLAKYLSIALRNAQLYERVQELNRRLETEVSITTRELIQTNSRLIHKVREMKVLSDIAAFAAAKTNLGEILEMIVEKVQELLSAQAAGFFLYEPGTDELIPSPPFFGIRDRDFAKLHVRPAESPVLAAALQQGKTQILNEAQAAASAVPLLGSLVTLQSLVLVPLRSNNKSIGILGVANKFGAAFDADDVRILELIADRISGVIENVRLYRELERRVNDLEVLQQVSSAISSEPVWEQTLKKIISTATQAFSADLCALLFYDEKNRELVTQPGAYFTGGDEAVLLRIPVDDVNSLSAQVFRSGELFLSPDASIDPRIKSQTSRLWDVRSLILVPLKAENRVIGVLRIGKHQANWYTRSHLDLAAMIAHQAAIIIENAHLYDSLRDTTSELERLNQIKNEFISMVSHELRTPLTAVKGFVKVVLQGEAGPVTDQQSRFLQIADQSIDRLTVLISDLLDISRMEAGQLSLHVDTLDPRAIIEESVRNLSPEAASKKLKLQARLPDKLPMVSADHDRVMQVLSNLIVNSVKFTPENGAITVSAQDKGDFVIFSVTDTGIGIAAKDHQKIFEKFFQVDSGSTRSGNGTGLGLAIVKTIVELHGGQVWVESEPGSGSTFRFNLPRAKTEIRDFRKELKDFDRKRQESPRLP